MKLNGPRSISILGGHPIANSVPGYYGQRVTRKESICNNTHAYIVSRWEKEAERYNPFRTTQVH